MRGRKGNIIKARYISPSSREHFKNRTCRNQDKYTDELFISRISVFSKKRFMCGFIRKYRH